MAMMDISVVPVGTGSPSVSRYVADMHKLLEQETDITFQLTAMSTIVEGDLEKLLAVAQKLHRSAFTAGAKRVATNIRLDERTDKPLTIEGKVKAVKDKLTE
jgi:uncharacterized protein (TIGR00106 family)